MPSINKNQVVMAGIIIYPTTNYIHLHKSVRIFVLRSPGYFSQNKANLLSVCLFWFFSTMTETAYKANTNHAFVLTETVTEAFVDASRSS